MPIKANAEIEAMAQQLAVLRGQSPEEAVASALRAELAREPGTHLTTRRAHLTPVQQAKVERMLEIVRLGHSAQTGDRDHSAFLYDDQGLPH